MVAAEWGLTTDEHERGPGSNFNEIAFLDPYHSNASRLLLTRPLGPAWFAK